MESVLSHTETEAPLDGRVAAPQDELARAEEALTRLVQDAMRPDVDRPSDARQADFAAIPRISAPSIEVEPRSFGGPGVAAAPVPQGRRVGRTIFRILIVIGIGVVATAAWQSYGSAARHMVAAKVSALAGLSAPAVTPSTPAVVNQRPDGGAVQTAATPVAPAQPAAADVTQDVKVMTRDLAMLRQRVDQLIANQEQMSRTIARLQAAGEEVEHRLSTATAAPQPAHKPAAKSSVAQTSQSAPQALAPGPRPLWQSQASPGPAPPQPRVQ